MSSRCFAPAETSFLNVVAFFDPFLKVPSEVALVSPFDVSLEVVLLRSAAVTDDVLSGSSFVSVVTAISVGGESCGSSCVEDEVTNSADLSISSSECARFLEAPLLVPVIDRDASALFGCDLAFD